MKRQIRSCAFETNSSSTHTLVICTEDDYNAFKDDKKRLDGDELVDYVNISKKESLEKAEQIYNSEKMSFWKDWGELEDSDKDIYIRKAKYEFSEDNSWLKTYEDFYEYGYYETFTKKFTTPSGDNMVAFGRYGYDG